jgi:16S rRNA (uracil1498-N3)-methyltransferase
MRRSAQREGSPVSVPRFHVGGDAAPGAAGSEFALPEAVAHHALRVLRLAIGDRATLFTGKGGEFAATLLRAGKRDAVVRIDGFDPVDREPALAVTLVQGLAANDAMDLAVRKAIELGVAAIVPVVTVRSARMPDGERGAKRLAHWRQVAVAACEQCGRNRVPVVHESLTLAQWLDGRVRDGQAWILDPNAERALAAEPPPPAGLALLIGPEGGFAAGEIAQARASGVIGVRLGPRVLRTETAGPAALAAIHALWGDFR